MKLSLRYLMILMLSMTMIIGVAEAQERAQPSKGQSVHPSNGIPGQFVKLPNGLLMHYQKSGSGDIPIIFIPGWMMSTEVFEHQLSHFENSTKFIVYAIDPRAQGYTSDPVEGHTYQQHARDLDEFITVMGLDNVILAGWSFGVTEQLAYVAQFGHEKLAGMIMIDTGPKVRGGTMFSETCFDDVNYPDAPYTPCYDEWVWYLKDDADEFSRFFTEGIVETPDFVLTDPDYGFIPWMMVNPTPESVTKIKAITDQTSHSVASMTNATGFYLNYEDKLAALNGKLPLLYIVRQDIGDWGIAAEWVTTNTPNSSFAALGGHIMFWEFPLEFNAIVDTFLMENF